jgi:hypothetical protein
MIQLKNCETTCLCIGYEKISDKVDINKLWDIMVDRGYPQHLIRVIQRLYVNTKIIIENEWRSDSIQQGCSLSPTLFNTYMDEVENGSWN